MMVRAKLRLRSSGGSVRRCKLIRAAMIDFIVLSESVMELLVLCEGRRSHLLEREYLTL